MALAAVQIPQSAGYDNMTEMLNLGRTVEYIDIDTNKVPYRFDIKLWDRTFILTVKYNVQGGFFTVDLETTQGEVLAYGAIVRYGRPLFGSIEDDRFPLPVIIPWTRCNNWVVRPWFKEGDVGLLVYLDHDIDKVVDDGKESDPNTERNHSDSDAIFVGGIVLGQKDIADLASNGCPDESLALGSVDGKHWIAICEDKIQSQADLWQHEGDIEIKGNIDIEGDITLQGDIDQTGDLKVTGEITATGEISSDADVKAAGISLKNHTHQVNLANAGGPVVGPTNPPN